jgi:hypothetical protein
MRATAADRTRPADTITIVLVSLLSWIVPGGGHLWVRRPQKGLVFITILPLMFLIGLLLHGRIFPFDASQPLVALAAIADLGAGLPYFIARGGGYGAGEVVATSYEYGNTFLIVAGLLNFLVMLDAYDILLGRK